MDRINQTGVDPLRQGIQKLSEVEEQDHSNTQEHLNQTVQYF